MTIGSKGFPIILDITGLAFNTPTPRDSPMKVLFLDFDGVLTSSTDGTLSLSAPTGPISIGELTARLSRRRIGYLNEILAEAGSLVVLTTPWREIHHQKSLVDALEVQGFKGRLLGITPSLSVAKMGRAVYKHDEIQAWVSLVAPDTFIILDSIAMGPLNDHLLRIEDGLEEDHIARAVSLFSELSD